MFRCTAQDKTFSETNREKSASTNQPPVNFASLVAVAVFTQIVNRHWMFYCYILLCSDNSYYVGVSVDPPRRTQQQEINREYFDGELSGVTIEWSHLDSDSGQARKLGEESL